MLRSQSTTPSLGSSEGDREESKRSSCHFLPQGKGKWLRTFQQQRDFPKLQKAPRKEH